MTDNRIHVLFLIDILYGVAGAEGVLLRATERLPKDRYRCSVGTFRVRQEMIGLFSCPVHVFPLERSFSFQSVSTAMALRRFIRKEKVDVVHTFFQAADLWGGLVTRIGRKVSLVSSRRDLGFMRSPKQKLGYQLMAGVFDQVQAVSEQVRRFSIDADRLNPEKVVTIPNGVEMKPCSEDRSECRASLDIPPQARVICSVGHIRRIKGVDIFLRTAEKVCRKFPDTVFLIVGCIHEPDLFAELQKFVREKGIERNVRFLGRRDDVPRILHASDVFCLLSRSEGMSNAVLEAMAAGLPCVVTDVGGNPEVIESGRNGFLVPTENVEAATNALSTLLKNPNLADVIGNKGRQTVENRYSVDKMVSRMADQYEFLVKGKAAAATASSF